MKKRPPSKNKTPLSRFVGLGLVLTLFVGSSGCGRNSVSSASILPLKKFVISGNDTMKYDVEAIDARAGQPCEVTFKNVGTLPRVAMGHNFVLLKLHTPVSVFLEAGTPHGATDYIAPEQKTNVIAATKMLGPGESDTITFNAPGFGNYDFICTFPGHYPAGMKGTFVVYP